MSKPKLFIDVDGVLFGYYDDHFQLRPGVLTFLDFATRHFDCYWLTVWTEEAIHQLLRSMYGHRLLREIKKCVWHEFKTEAINLDDDFYWIEDGIHEEELTVLERADKADRYIYCDPNGRDALDRVYATLDTILKVRS